MFTENPEEYRLDQKLGKGAKLKEESCDEMSSDNDSVSEVDEDQFQQHHYLFLFDDELALSKAAPLDEPLAPEQFTKMKLINRRKLCEYFDSVTGRKGVSQDIVVEVSHVDGPGEQAEVIKKVITVSEEDESSHSANTDQRLHKRQPKQRFPVKARASFA